MTTLAPPATPAARVLPTRRELVDMLSDRLTAVVAMVCVTVVSVTLLLVLGWSATHGGELLVLTSAISGTLPTIIGLVLKYISGKNPPTG